MIRLIGYWKTSFSDDYPFPQELETAYAIDVRDAVARYLEGGTLLVQYRGLSWCRYECGLPANGSRELFDGEWAWPEGLAHYIRAHSVGLPPDFIRHVVRQKEPPRIVGNSEHRHAELDDTDWIEWARPQRTPAVTNLLVAARHAAERACDTRLEAQAAELAARQGVGNTVCNWAGCGRQRLAGKAICARHAVDSQLGWIRGQADFEELRNVARALSTTGPSP